MSKHNSEPDRARALQDASAWRVRLNESNSESSLAFEAWLSESPAHRDAWEAVQAPWELLGEHASNTELVALRRGALARAHRASRGRVSPPFWRRMAAAAALVLVICAGGTRDAHGVYAALGFEPVAAPERLMEIRNPAPYGIPV